MCCHQDKLQPGCIMEEPGSLRVLLDITGGRELVRNWGRHTAGSAVAMDALVCRYKQQGNLHHGCIGWGMMLTLDIAVARL